MNQTQLAALLAFLAGTAAAMTGSALLREAPGAKSYFVHQLEVRQAPSTDGGLSIVSAQAFTTATLALGDGGTSTVDLGGVDCALSAGNQTTLRNILSAATSCAQNAP